MNFIFQNERHYTNKNTNLTLYKIDNIQLCFGLFKLDPKSSNLKNFPSFSRIFPTTIHMKIQKRIHKAEKKKFTKRIDEFTELQAQELLRVLRREPKDEVLPHQSSPAPEAEDSATAFHDGPYLELQAVRREAEDLLLDGQTPLTALRPPDDAVG